MSGTESRRAKFALEYLIDYNGTQAAIRAGYSKKSARSQASRLLTDRNVLAAIAEGLAQQIDRTKLTADTVLAGLWREAISADTSRDRRQAYEAIGKHFAMFTDKVDVNADLSPIRFELTDDSDGDGT
jgi:phage terminase small subunit